MILTCDPAAGQHRVTCSGTPAATLLKLEGKPVNGG
jgi:hypothetical protein